jgi:hypothetical protein
MSPEIIDGSRRINSYQLRTNIIVLQVVGASGGTAAASKVGKAIKDLRWLAMPATMIVV